MRERRRLVADASDPGAGRRHPWRRRLRIRQTGQDVRQLVREQRQQARAPWTEGRIAPAQDSPEPHFAVAEIRGVTRTAPARDPCHQRRRHHKGRSHERPQWTLCASVGPSRHRGPHVVRGRTPRAAAISAGVRPQRPITSAMRSHAARRCPGVPRGARARSSRARRAASSSDRRCVRWAIRSRSRSTETERRSVMGSDTLRRTRVRDHRRSPRVPDPGHGGRRSAAFRIAAITGTTSGSISARGERRICPVSRVMCRRISDMGRLWHRADPDRALIALGQRGGELGQGCW